jgi:hypothetical protein
MRAIKATIQDGNITLDQPIDIKGRVDAIIVLLDPDPWKALIDDPRPRPALTKASQDALDEYLTGQATPLDSEAMS